MNLPEPVREGDAIRAEQYNNLRDAIQRDTWSTQGVRSRRGMHTVFPAQPPQEVFVVLEGDLYSLGPVTATVLEYNDDDDKMRWEKGDVQVSVVWDPYAQALAEPYQRGMTYKKGMIGLAAPIDATLNGEPLYAFVPRHEFMLFVLLEGLEPGGSAKARLIASAKKIEVYDPGIGYFGDAGTNGVCQIEEMDGLDGPTLGRITDLHCPEKCECEPGDTTPEPEPPPTPTPV